MAKKTKKSIVWISVKAAAELIHVTPVRVRQLIKAKDVRSRRDPNHPAFWLVNLADARRYRDSPRLRGKPGHKA
jgi:hypothetical protein